VNIWQSYKQEGGCLVHFVRLATTLLKDEEFTQTMGDIKKQPLLAVVTLLLKLGLPG